MFKTDRLSILSHLPLSPSHFFVLIMKFVYFLIIFLVWCTWKHINKQTRMDTIYNSAPINTKLLFMIEKVEIIFLARGLYYTINLLLSLSLRILILVSKQLYDSKCLSACPSSFDSDTYTCTIYIFFLSNFSFC